MKALRYVLVTIFGISMFFGANAAAASANLSTSYKTTANITSGSLVSLDPTNSGYVDISNQKGNQNLVGVAVTSKQSLLATNTNLGNVQVAISGVVNTLVSTLNGPIAVGDQVGVSVIDGVGIKALPGTKVAGIAQGAFNYNSTGASYVQVTNTSGQKTSIAVGYIPVVIATSIAPTTNTSNNSQNSIQKIASGISGRSVSVAQLVISAVIAIITIIAVIVIVYGTIRGSILSIGRNPLAKPAIYQSLTQVIGLVCLIVLTAVIAIYLIIR
jgi:hypothetical protein